MNRKIKIIWVPIILSITYLISTFLGDPTFEDFLARDMHIYSDRTNHTEGWTGPGGVKLDWDSAEKLYRLIYISYSYTFINQIIKKLKYLQ